MKSIMSLFTLSSLYIQVLTVGLVHIIIPAEQNESEIATSDYAVTIGEEVGD